MPFQKDQFGAAPRFINVQTLNQGGGSRQGGGGGLLGGAGGLLGALKTGYDIFSDRERAGELKRVNDENMAIARRTEKSTFLDGIDTDVQAYAPVVRPDGTPESTFEDFLSNKLAATKDFRDEYGVSDEEFLAQAKAARTGMGKDQRDMNYQSGGVMDVMNKIDNPNPLLKSDGPPSAPMNIPGAKASPAQEVSSMLKPPGDSQPGRMSNAQNAADLMADQVAGPPIPTPVEMQVQPEIDTSALSAKIGEPVMPEVAQGSSDAILQAYEKGQSTPRQVPDPTYSAKAARSYMKAEAYRTLRMNAAEANARLSQLEMLTLMSENDMASGVAADIEANFNVNPLHKQFTTPENTMRLADAWAMAQSDNYRAHKLEGYAKAAEKYIADNPKAYGGKKPSEIAQELVARDMALLEEANAKGYWPFAQARITAFSNVKYADYQKGQENRLSLEKEVTARMEQAKDLQVGVMTLQGNLANTAATNKATEQRAQSEAWDYQKSLLTSTVSLTGIGVVQNAANARATQKLLFEEEKLDFQRVNAFMTNNLKFQEINNSTIRNQLAGAQLGLTTLGKAAELEVAIAKARGAAEKATPAWKQGTTQPAATVGTDALTPELKAMCEKYGFPANTYGDALIGVRSLREAAAGMLPNGKNPLIVYDKDGNQQKMFFDLNDPTTFLQNYRAYQQDWGLTEDGLDDLENLLETDGVPPEDALDLSRYLDVAMAHGVGLSQEEFVMAAQRPDTGFKPHHYPLFAKMRNRRANGPATA
jgi:hypothetical protein